MLQGTVSLTECHALLKASMGEQAPALITLKRWSQSGRLDRAKVVGERRPTFIYSLVEKVAKDSGRKRQGKGGRRNRLRGGRGEVGGGTRDENERTEKDYEAINASLEQKMGWLVEALASKVSDKIGGDSARVAVEDSIGKAVKDQVALLGRDLVKGLETLDSVRRTVMVKYDEENRMLRERLVSLEKENATLRRDASSVDVQKLNIQLSKILDAINMAKSG